jgi:hypothetical protein
MSFAGFASISDNQTENAVFLEKDRTTSSAGHALLQFPVTTDGQTVLIETEAEQLDLYADPSGEVGQVEGSPNSGPAGNPNAPGLHVA